MNNGLLFGFIYECMRFSGWNHNCSSWKNINSFPSQFKLYMTNDYMKYFKLVFMQVKRRP